MIFDNLSKSLLYVNNERINQINSNLLNSKDKNIYNNLKKYNKNYIKLKCNIFASDFGRVQIN